MKKIKTKGERKGEENKFEKDGTSTQYFSIAVTSILRESWYNVSNNNKYDKKNFESVYIFLFSSLPTGSHRYYLRQQFRSLYREFSAIFIESSLKKSRRVWFTPVFIEAARQNFAVYPIQFR